MTSLQNVLGFLPLSLIFAFFLWFAWVSLLRVPLAASFSWGLSFLATSQLTSRRFGNFYRNLDFDCTVPPRHGPPPMHADLELGVGVGHAEEGHRHPLSTLCLCRSGCRHSVGPAGPDRLVAGSLR